MSDQTLPVAAPATPLKPRAGKIAWTTSTYFGEGLPWSFLHQMATEYLTAIGAPLAQIGYTSWLHLSVTFKFVWSPVVDFFATKRSWMVAMQAILGIGMLAVAGIAEQHNLPLFWLLLAILSIFHATHDIACDGFYMLALDKADQALYVGLRVAAFRAAMIVGSGVLVFLAGRTTWRMGFGAAGLIMLLLALGNWRFIPRPSEPRARREPQATPAQQPGQQRQSEFLAVYRTFFAQPQAVLVLSFMFFYKLGDIMMFAMSKPLLRDIGIDTARRGILAGSGIGMFIVGSMLGGGLIARWTLVRCLVPMTFFQNLAIPLYILLAVRRPGFAGAAVVVLVEQLAAGIGASAHVVFLMQRCKAAFSASHFAFATAIVALGSTVSGAVSGHLNAMLGHAYYFTLAFVLSWPGLVLVLLVPRSPLEAH